MKKYRQWKKGDKIKLNGGSIITVLNNGKYITGVSYGLIFYKVKREDNSIDYIYPCVGDEIIK